MRGLPRRHRSRPAPRRTWAAAAVLLAAVAGADVSPLSGGPARVPARDGAAIEASALVLGSSGRVVALEAERLWLAWRAGAAAGSSRTFGTQPFGTQPVCSGLAQVRAVPARAGMVLMIEFIAN